MNNHLRRQLNWNSNLADLFQSLTSCMLNIERSTKVTIISHPYFDHDLANTKIL